MRAFALFISICLSASVFAEEFVAEDSTAVAKRNETCESVVRKHIETKARAKGLTSKFGCI